MRTREEVASAAHRAHEVARFLVQVGGASGSPASVEDVLRWHDDMLDKKKDVTSIESGLIKLTADREGGGKPSFRLYVNVGPEGE